MWLNLNLKKMRKWKKRCKKWRPRAKGLVKKKEGVIQALCSSTSPPKISVSPGRQSRSFYYLCSAFSSITEAVMPLITTGLCLYRWCQNCFTQILRIIQQSIFPCHICRQELNVLRERVEKLEAELARIPSVVQNGTAAVLSEKSPCQKLEKLALTISTHTELGLSEPVSLPVLPPPPPPPPLPPPPPPQVPLCFKRKEATKTQAALLKKDVPMQITLKDLLNVKLKKTHTCTMVDKKRSPFHKQRTITVSDLQGVSLKSKSSRLPVCLTKSLNTPSRMQLDFRKHLRKVSIKRSPGGTPLTNKENIETGTGLTPIMTQALRRKFQLAHPKSPSPSQLLRGSSFEDQS